MKLLRGEGDELNYWTKRKLAISKDIDEVVEDEYAANYGSCDIQTHLKLAMLGADDDVVSNSTPSKILDLSPAKKPRKIICMGVTDVQPTLIDLHKLL